MSEEDMMYHIYTTSATSTNLGLQDLGITLKPIPAMISQMSNNNFALLRTPSLPPIPICGRPISVVLSPASFHFPFPLHFGFVLVTTFRLEAAQHNDIMMSECMQSEAFS